MTIGVGRMDKDEFGDGIPFGLPTYAEALEGKRRAAELAATPAARAKPWPEPRDPGWLRDLRDKWPDGVRLRTAWELALDLDTLHGLLAGQAVDPNRIDQDALRRARQARLVQLVRPINLLIPAA